MHPRNYIAGGGVFSHATNLPLSLAWEAFGPGNGVSSLAEMRTRIAKYRRQIEDSHVEYVIGCRLLVQPFFFSKDDWIPVPASWAPQTQVGKTYRTNTSDGRRLWDQIQERLNRQPLRELAEEQPPFQGPRYGEPTLILPRLGQGTFRVLVTDAYGRRCAVSKEKALPVLEAAHIRPYAKGGAHSVKNGLLLRSDIHKLFDLGYVTVTTDYKVEVSRKLREEFENGETYYKFHGFPITLPEQPDSMPEHAVLTWHNARFRG
jgi:putative restriction endonuclease